MKENDVDVQFRNRCPGGLRAHTRAHTHMQLKER